MQPVPLSTKFRTRILVITGEEIRHRYFVNQMNARFPLAAVFTEAFDYPEPKAASTAEEKAWNWFFRRRQEYENRAFGDTSLLPALNSPPVGKIGKGRINSPETVEKIKRIKPDFIAIFGTSLLGPGFINAFPGRIYNLHVGLPDYYRGTSCNFWPIHNNRIEHLGASVHQVTEEIDGGEITAMAEISLEAEDDEQTLAGKTVILGTQLMIATIENWQKGKLPPSHPQKKGRLFLMKDFTPQAVFKVRRMVETGELKKQIALIHRTERKNALS